MPHPRTSKKPEGLPTRGKTASNRLRRVDNFVLLYEPSLLMRTDGPFADALFVDLGYGSDARRSMESNNSLLERQEHTLAGTSAPGLHNWYFEALVFSTNFRTGFDVEEFQTILPKNLIHRVIPGEPVFDFFEAWKASAIETSAMKTYGAKQWFIAAAERLAGRGYPLATQRKWLNRGFLIWKLEPS